MGFVTRGVYIPLNAPFISSISLWPLTLCVQIVREKKEALCGSRNAIPLLHQVVTSSKVCILFFFVIPIISCCLYYATFLLKCGFVVVDLITYHLTFAFFVSLGVVIIANSSFFYSSPLISGDVTPS